MKTIFSFLFCTVVFCSFGQKTKVHGIVTDQLTGEVMPYASVRFQNTKVGCLYGFEGKSVQHNRFRAQIL